MPQVLPFPAWRYNLKKVCIEDVVAPPYDVVTQEEIKFYKEKAHTTSFTLSYLIAMKKQGSSWIGG